MLTAEDIHYIRAEFVSLDELCPARSLDSVVVRVAIEEQLLPSPAYMLPDGAAMVPADYFELPLGNDFVRRYRGNDLEADLEAFMKGTYFVCLLEATPENIVRKGELVDELRSLLEQPRPEENAWQVRLRAGVDELDALERPFSPHFDRERFGRPPTRDELIEAPRSLYPSLWDRAA